MQKRCQRLAEKFNSLGAPKKVNFIDTCIVEFVQRPADHTGGAVNYSSFSSFSSPGHPIMIMEPRLEGTYKKYSNNFGYVDKEDRNTPQVCHVLLLFFMKIKNTPHLCGNPHSA